MYDRANIRIISNSAFVRRNFCRTKIKLEYLANYNEKNIERFPENFMFQLTEIEWQYMSSQFVMTSKLH